MNTLQTNYQALVSCPEDSETPQVDESVIFHSASERGKSRWNHVDDLDSFFRRIRDITVCLASIEQMVFENVHLGKCRKRNASGRLTMLHCENTFLTHMFTIFCTGEISCNLTYTVDRQCAVRSLYTYHQKHGFLCIITEEALRLVTFVLIILGVVFGFNCIEFKFDETIVPHLNATEKISFKDLFLPPSTCAKRFGFWTWLCVVLGFVFALQRVYKFISNAYGYREIEQFYSSAMKIHNADLDNITWHDVQCRLREVQHEQQMCVHKSDLTELDIYHRILRHKNYMVAMVNKNVLPLRQNVKYIGEWVYLSTGLKYNIELLLFGSSLSPFKGTGSLKEECKKYAKRKDVAAELSRNMLICGIINLVLSPFIFLWQLLIFFVKYSGFIRREPSLLSMRKWSHYSRLYLRHFNELDHELDARLNRASQAAKEYLKSFTSPLLTVISRFIAKVTGSLTVALVVWALFKEQLFQIDHVLIFITIGSCIFIAAASCIPDENTVFIPDRLMLKIVADVHYAPDHWRSKAHSTLVRDEFSQLFQYKFIYLIEELVSPIVTPYILIFQLRHRALDIVDFFRSFTVDVAGVGDVCSFSLMDVSRHGNHQWFIENHTKADQYQQAEDGKTELSLLHFTMMNPHWKPPEPSNNFIHNLKEQAILDRVRPNINLENPLYSSLNSLSALGSRYANLVNSSLHPNLSLQASTSMMDTGVAPERYVLTGGVNRAEGPPYLLPGGFLSSLQENDGQDSTVNAPQSLQSDMNPVEIRAVDMSLSALYLHEVHQLHLRQKRYGGKSIQTVESPTQDEARNEVSPLLDVRRIP